MKTFTSYFLALILTLSAISVDAHLVSDMSRLQEGHALTEGTEHHEFVLIGTEQAQERTAQLRTPKPKPVSTPATTVYAILQYAHRRDTVAKSNVPFMSRRNCVSIPLRL